MEEFYSIYRDSAQKVYRFLLRLSGDADLAEELTAETFYQAFLHIDKFRGECAVDTWLSQIAKNAYYKEINRRRRHLPECEANNLSTPDEYMRLEDRQTALAIHKLLHALPEPYREVFSLRVFGELQFDEIAAVFGKSVSWAKMTFYRAKAKLVEEMEAQDGKDG